MKTTEEMLKEIENANNGDGPDPVATVDDPALAKIALAQMRLGAAAASNERSQGSGVGQVTGTGSGAPR